MSSITYSPNKDELLIEFKNVKKQLQKMKGNFNFFFNDEGAISAIRIKSYTQVLEEFKKSMNCMKLGGIWKHALISDRDIIEARKELLEKIEEKD